MSDDHDLAWYRERWKELTELLSVEDSGAVVPEVRRLRNRVETVSDQLADFAEARVEEPEEVVCMIDNLVDQLEELYAERERPELSVTLEGEDDEPPASD